MKLKLPLLNKIPGSAFVLRTVLSSTFVLVVETAEVLYAVIIFIKRKIF